MATSLNITNIPAPRVPFIDERTGLMAREWYRFFLNLFILTGSGSNPTTLDELQIGPPNQPDFTELLIQINKDIAPQYEDQSGDFLKTLDTAQLMSMMSRFENAEAAIQGAYLQPPQLPVDGVYVVGPSSSTDNAVARFDGTTGKLIQNSITTIDDTGNASGILSQQFSDGTAVTLAAGKLWYNGTTGSWNGGMGNGNITQQIGEEIFIYGKASAAITDSPLQIVYKTGVVGASGVIQFAPTVAGITEADQILGIATESLAHNAFGRITTFGIVRAITTNGTAFGEVWADNDDIYYNPVTGNPTKTKPVAPNIKVQLGTIIHAGSGGSGSFFVSIGSSSTLGGTDSNVQFGTLANNNLVAYDSAVGYWKNVTTGTGVVTALGVNIGSAGAVVLFDGALGTPSSGTVTNLTGTASININGTVGATTPAAGTFTSLSDSGNLTFTGTGNRITGDFSNATGTNRVAFQSSTTNGNTVVGLIPNGTSTQSQAIVYNNSDIANANGTQIVVNATESRLQATNSGTAGQLPMTFYAGGSERVRITTAGRVGIGTGATVNYALEVSTDSAGKPGVGGLWTVVSDERIKSDIAPANLDRCYEIVKSVPLKYFGFAPGVYNADQIQDNHNLGWIAQDVQKVFKNAVSVKPFTPATGDVIEDCLDLNSGQIIAALYGAVQSLMEKIETLTERVAVLEAK